MGFQDKLPSGHLCLATAVVTLLVVMPSAYQNTVADQPQDILKSFTNISFHHQFGRFLTPNELDSLWGFLVSASGFAALPASLLLPSIVKRFGTKRTLFICASVCNILCGALECLAKYVGNFQLFILGQLFGPGFGWTFAFGLAPVYLAECSPADKRGMTGTFVSFGFYVGILLSFILGISPLLGTDDLWGIYMAVTVGPAVLGLLAVFFFPESPKHLYIEEENPEASRQVIEKFYGHTAKVETIFGEFDQEANLTSTEISLREILREKHLRMPLLLSVVAEIFIFTCGPMITMTFSTPMFHQFLPPLQAQMATVLMALPLPFLSIASSFAMEKWGRRPLLIWGGVAMQICLGCYVIFGVVADYTGLLWPSYVAVCGLVLNMWISPLGPLPIGMFLVSEITPQASRTLSSAVCVIFSMATHSALNWSFPSLISAIGYWAVLFLLILPSVACLIFLWLKLPETKDQPISKIIDNWITPKRKETLVLQRCLSMVSMGRKESLVMGKRVSIEDLPAFQAQHLAEVKAEFHANPLHNSSTRRKIHPIETISEENDQQGLTTFTIGSAPCSPDIGRKKDSMMISPSPSFISKKSSVDSQHGKGLKN